MVQLLNNSSPNTDRVRRRSEQRQREILQAASRVFRRNGFAAAGMREIADEADLSPGNLYHYFKGKQEILYYCQDQALDLMQQALEQANQNGGSISSKLHAVLSSHILCILNDMTGSAAHLAVDDLPPELRTRIVRKRDRYERGVRKLVQTGEQAGEFRVANAGMITRAMFGAMNWTVQWFDPRGPHTAAQVAEATAAYLVGGVRQERLGD
jgi:AcrR family transcriptional regulator